MFGLGTVPLRVSKDGPLQCKSSNTHILRAANKHHAQQFLSRAGDSIGCDHPVKIFQQQQILYNHNEIQQLSCTLLGSAEEPDTIVEVVRHAARFVKSMGSCIETPCNKVLQQCLNT